MLQDLLMMAHFVALWIALSFWCVLTWATVPYEDQDAAAVLWWITTILTGVLAGTFYVFQMR